MKKNNNKGFTLVEIIAVIGILLLMATITVPSLISIQNRNKNTTDKKTIELIENSAQIFFEMNRSKIQNIDALNTGLCLRLKHIINEGYLKKPEGISENTFVKIIKSGQKIQYIYNSGCTNGNIIIQKWNSETKSWEYAYDLN